MFLFPFWQIAPVFRLLARRLHFYTSLGGNTILSFVDCGRGVLFSLDASGHLVSIGPTASGVVGTHPATFQIGSTFGPVTEMARRIGSAFVPIVCTINAKLLAFLRIAAETGSSADLRTAGHCRILNVECSVAVMSRWKTPCICQNFEDCYRTSVRFCEAALVT